MNEPGSVHHHHPTMMHGMLWQPMPEQPRNSLFRSSVSAQVPVAPQGQQNESLGSAARSGLMIAENAVFGHHQVHFDKKAGKAEKAAIVAGEARTLAEQVANTASYVNVAVWANNKLTQGQIPADHFTRSFQALGSISVATQGLAFIKAAGETGFHTVKDISAHKKRGEAQSLLKDYNPETASFTKRSGSKAKKERLQALVSDSGADLSRSKKQVAADRLTDIKDLVHKGAGLANAAVLLAGNTSAKAAQVAPGVGIAVAALGTVNSAVKTGIQVVALNNLAKAEAATKDPLLKALSGHIKQERTTLARKNLINTAVQAVSTGVSIGLAASGVGAPAALIASGAIGTAVSIGTLAFDGYHGRQLAKKRASADELLANGGVLASLAKDNIGVAEKAFLARLRMARGAELKECVSFLRDFGVTDNTIKKLQLAPEEESLKALQNVLYNDKVQFKGVQLKQTVKTLAHVVGLTALGKRIRAGSQWLQHRLLQHRSKDQFSSAGHSIFYAPFPTTNTGAMPALSRRDAVKRRQTHSSAVKTLPLRPARRLQTLSEYQYARLNHEPRQRIFKGARK